MVGAFPRGTRQSFTLTWSADRGLLTLAAVLLLSIGLRLPDLGESLWYDEIWSTRLMLGDWQALRSTIVRDYHPPLYTVFMAGWVKVFGDSEIAVRFPSLLAGLVSIAISYLLARRIIGRAPAVLVAILMALSPVHIWYSQEAGKYAILLLSVLGIIYSYYRLHEAPSSNGWLAAYTVACFVAALTHAYAVVFVGLTCLLALANRDRIARKMLFAGAPAVLTLGSFLAYRWRGGLADVGYLRPFTPHELWMLFFQWFTSGNALWTANQYGGPSVLLEHPPRLLLQIGLALLTLRGLHRLITSGRYGRDAVVLLLGLPMVLLAVGLTGHRGYIERSLLALMPLFFLALASGVTSFNWRPATVASWGLALGVSAVALGQYMTHKDQWTVYKPNPDWQSMVRELDAERQHHDLPSLVYTTAPATELAYYASWMREVEPGALLAGRATEGEPAQRVAEIRFAPRDVSMCGTAAQQRKSDFYFLRNRYWDGGSGPVLERALLDGTCTLVEHRSYKGLDLYRFRSSS